jgi:outer membrane receptor protein involved in Fe transport
MKTAIHIARLMGGISLIAGASAALAQTANPASPTPVEDAQATSDLSIPTTAADIQDSSSEEIVVIGSQIRGADVAGNLPVTLLNEKDIDAIAATSGDELFRAIPQAGDVAFNESRDAGGINDARGDVASINLRALGTGNTLVLLNGRRMVLHPGSQTENLVPVQSVNTNAIPVLGVRRVETLLDGAAAIYGSDAVAGVINTVLKDNLKGFRVTGELGFTHDSDQHEYQAAFEGGHTFNDGMTNISVFGSFNHRDPLHAADRFNSRSSDLRPLVAGTPFAGDANFDNTSTDGMWGEFLRLNSDYTRSTAIARVNGEQLTTSGAFHIQPATNEGCIAPGPAANTCWDNSTLSTLTIDNSLKYDVNSERTIQGRNQRFNLFTFINHEFASGIKFFGEAGWYHADFQSVREQETSLTNQRLIVPANAYWNPFGPLGSPNRIPGLTGVANGGAALELQDYRPVDAGPLVVDVVNDTYRFVGGFRGELWGFDWETAGLYSKARTVDTMRTVSLTKFQEALSRTDASGYNPFNGGDPFNPRRRDSTPNPQSVIDSFMVDISRTNETELALADFKISTNDLFRLPGGRVGMAAGVEFRRETFFDDRDDRLDGTVAFTALDGSSNGSDTLGASPTPDSRGKRDVFSGFVELAVPLVSPEMEVPLIRSLDLQLAGRAESYQGFGSVAKPKVALSWYPVRNFQLRGSWSQGFRAPNLPQLFENGVERANGRLDYIRCEADLRAGRIASINNCAQSQSVVSNRSGSRELTPETSDNLSVGATGQFNFGDAGRLTLTADYWEIRQKDVIGILGDTNAILLDYLLRLRGSSNPMVERAAPSAEDVADFADTGLAPVGDIIQLRDAYVNLAPRTVRGFDLGAYYAVRDTALGDFNLRVNAARLLEFNQTPGPVQQALLDAQAAGEIPSTIIIPGAEDIVEQNGRPKWRGTASLTWSSDQWGAGWYGSYVGKVTDSSASLTDGGRFRVPSHVVHSLYVQYTVDDQSFMDGARFRLGARNLFNNLPPLADQPYGYFGELYNNRGRQVYASVNKRF